METFYHEGNIIFLTKDSADKFANEVRTLINDMRSEQQQDNSQKKTEASGNRLVTDERYAELRERMRKKLLGQMNIGIDLRFLPLEQRWLFTIWRKVHVSLPSMQRP